ATKEWQRPGGSPGILSRPHFTTTSPPFRILFRNLMAQFATAPVAPVGSGGKLIPRLSQQEIFHRAIDENIICTMETGSGMFHIAILLLRHIISIRKIVSDSKKVAVFIVNSVPLAEQQAELLQSQLPLRVKKFYGSMGLNYWDRERWNEAFAELDVIVLTGQVLHDLLNRGHWSLNKVVSLLVFSEAHHCNKNHVYANIMRTHYGHCPISERPRIFGMTASPIFNIRNPVQSLERLQENMDSKVLAVRDSTFELALNAPKPAEFMMEPPPPASVYSDYPTPNMWTIFSEFEYLIFPEPGDIKDLSGRFEHVLNELGPLAADYFVLLHIHQTIEKNDTQSTIPGRDSLEETPEPSKANGGLSIDPRRNWSDLNNKYHESRACIQERIQGLDKLRMLSWFTPKLHALIAILEANRTADFNALVIVEQRQVASVLTWLLSFVPELRGWARASALSGQGYEGNLSYGTTSRARVSQQSTLRDFRSGSINLLITTSMAEVGLDFPACKLVIRLHAPQTMASYLQSRGIARNHGSAYVVLVDPEGKKRYRSLQDAEAHLRRLYQNAGDDQPQTSDDTNVQEKEEVGDERYNIKSTGAVVTPSTAISILYLWCSLLAVDQFTRPLVPEFHMTGNYMCNLTIPPSIINPSLCGSMQGPERATWGGARRAAAYLLVKKLHQLGILNDGLIPVKKSESYREDGSRHVCEAPQMEDPSFNTLLPWGDVWQSGSPVWMSAISLGGSLPLIALVTGRRQTERELIIDKGDDCIRIKIHYGRLLDFISEEEKLVQLETMQRYSSCVILWAITSRRLPLRPSCFFIPLTDPEGLPDYDKMNGLSTNVIELHKDAWSNLEFMERHVMEAHRLGSTVYKPLGLRSEVALSSHPITLEGQAKCREVDHETYRSYWEAALNTVKRRSHLDIPEDDLWVELISINKAQFQPQNGLYGLVKLTNSSQPVVEPSRIIIPSHMARVSPIAADIIEAGTLLPDILGQLALFNLMDSVNESLQTRGVPFELLLEALTLPSVQAGFDNQRLKVIGNSVLNLCLSTHPFVKYQGHHGGQLSAMKDSVISDDNLAKIGRQSPLPRFIINDSLLTDKLWGPLPSSTISETRNDFDEEQTISGEKHEFEEVNFHAPGLVDCTKSTLGAAYLSCGIGAALEVGHALGLPLGGPTPWHLRQEALAFFQTCEMTELFAAIEEKFEYKFQNSTLVAEAFRHTTYNLPQGPSYHRLEFLGGSLFDLYAARYAYLKFPDMTAEQISSTRGRLASASVLGKLAVNLGLHKFILSSSANLQKVVADFAREVEFVSLEETLQSYWKIDPPKVIVDVFKATLGAIYVDSPFNLELVFERIHRIAAEIVEYLGPGMPMDPASELVHWLTSQGCQAQENTIFKYGNVQFKLDQRKASKPGYG
ncbi:unnamed protein product, partial [Rhizoctonia solani]